MVATHPKGLTNLTCDSKHTGSTQTKTKKTHKYHQRTKTNMTPKYFLICYYFYFSKIRKFPNPKIGSPQKKQWDQYRLVNGAASLCMMYCTIYCRPSCKLSKHSWRNRFVRGQNRSIDFMELSAAPKNTRWENEQKSIRSIESWLFERDPYNGLL